MNLIKRILLVVLTAGAFAQPAYSMDFVTITRVIEFIRPHAAKVGWYSANQAWYFVLGNGPVIAASSFIAYMGIKRFLSGKLGKIERDVTEIKSDVKENGKKIDVANLRLGSIEKKQVEHGTILNSVQNNIATANIKIDNVITNQETHGEKLGYLTKGQELHQKTLLDILHGQEDMENGLKVLDKKIDDIAITLNNDRAKKEDQEKAFDQLIKQQENLYKAVGQLQENGKLQSDDIILKIAALDEKIDKTQNSYITRMDRLEAELKKYKEESNKRFKEQSEQLKNQAQLLEEQKKQMADLHAAYAELRKELKDRDDKLMKFLEKSEEDRKKDAQDLKTSVSNMETIALTLGNRDRIKGLPSPVDNQPLGNFFKTDEIIKMAGKQAEGIRLSNISSRSTIGINPMNTLNQPSPPVYVSTESNPVTGYSLFLN